MKSLLMLALFSSIAIAAPKAKKAEPTWYCFMAVDSNAQTVEACERTETACGEDIITNELDTDKVRCYGATKALAFIIRHKNDGKLETLAVPEMKACQYLSQTMVNEDIDLVVACKVTP